MSSSLIPQAPIHSSIDKTVQTNVTTVMAVIAVAALIFSLAYWKRTGRPTFMLLYVAGGLMMFLEPMVDTVGACWFPRGNSWVVFTLWGRPMPVWLCETYFFYFGIGVGGAWLLMRRGLTARGLWLLFAGGMLADFILETTLLHWDTWIYYGDQPLVLAKFPLWWAPVNALIVMVAAALVYRCEAYLAGRRQLVIVPILLTTSAAMNTAAGWPSWLAINSHLGYAGRQICGLATYAVAFWLMSVVVRFVAIPARAGAPAPERTREPAATPLGSPSVV